MTKVQSNPMFVWIDIKEKKDPLDFYIGTMAFDLGIMDQFNMQFGHVPLNIY